jgi:DNA-binding MarR family transcriptional regulator
MNEQVLTVENEFQLLEALAASPETTQADLAAQVGVAIGTVNWYLKRWSKKGYVKVSRIGRWQWSYLLTPEGIARKATLAAKYVEASLSLYRRTRSEAQRLLGEIKLAGYEAVVISGEGEIAEICRLTCLELGVQRWDSLNNGINGRQNNHLPQLCVDGAKLALSWPQER